MSEMSFEDFAGEAAKPADSSSSSGDIKRVSPANLSFEEFTGQPSTPDTTSSMKPAFDRTLLGLKRMGGEAAALGDLILSMPGFLVGVGAQLGATTRAMAAGEGRDPLLLDQDKSAPDYIERKGGGRSTPGTITRRHGSDQVERRFLRPLNAPDGRMTPFSVGREAASIPEKMMNPLQKILTSLQGEEFYAEAATTKGMEKFSQAMEEAGEWAEKASGGRVSRDAIPMFVETLMAGSAGAVKGGKGLDPALLKRTTEAAQQTRQRMLEKAEAEATSARDAAAAEMLTPEEFAMRRPVQSEINAMLGIRTTAEQAAVTRQRRKDVKQAFERQPEEGGDYGSRAESEFRAEERLSNEEAYANEVETNRIGGTAYEVGAEAKPEKVGQTEILKIMQKPGFERTAEDLLTLRAARQEGKASPEALMLLSAAGIGATVGGLLTDDQLKGAMLGGVAMGAPAAMMAGLRAGGVRSNFKQAGAVKGPGGMWHPETVERLSNPIAEKLVTASGMRHADARNLNLADPNIHPHAKEIKGAVDQADRMIRNYLNRYAGTEKDPLKDVEIPWQRAEQRGDVLQNVDTARWGEVWDQAVSPRTAKELKSRAKETNEAILKAPDEEKIWTLNQFLGGGTSSSANSAITSYLSHVGDYLRQNVKPEDLPRYDLVRAVRETAENDKRVAKQMEKTSSDSTKQLPVYKEYSDGFKWVELKKPEKLTEEQAKTVRKATDAEMKKLGSEVDGDLGYVAISPDGKPLKNAYTGEIAAAGTPEEAYLAGRLAEEGNTMGHCVGGYCEGVAAGESKIYSLRDPKGKSHVTIEVTPPDVRDEGYTPVAFFKQAPKEVKERIGSEPTRGQLDTEGDFTRAHRFWKQEIIKDPAYREWLAEQPHNVQQIKGKQNRAPNKEYLPYVQDFVKSGKWGEVGDLGNAGLIDLHRHAELYARGPSNRPADFLVDAKEHYKKAFEEKFGGRYTTEEAYNKAFEQEGFDPKRIGSKRQEGKIDQQLVVGMSALGLGGLVGAYLSDDKLSGALLGALAAGALSLPGGRARIKQAIEMADYGLGAISTRIGNISEPLKLRAREYERRVLTRSHEELTKVVPFLQELNRLPKSEQMKLERAILTGNSAQIADLMTGNVKLVEGWRKAKNVLSDLGKQLQGHGRFATMLDDYYPRLVKDVEGLKAALGTPERTRLEAALADAEKTAIKNRGTPLTEVEKSSIINREVQGFRRAKGYQPGFAKARGVDEITAQLQPFYHTASESLYAYVRASVQDLEMAKFFGRDLVQTEKGKQTYINVEGSVGNLVGRELAEGWLNHKQAQELIKILQSRFSGGERSPNRLVQEVRNLGNLGLLGNIVSAATQMSDTAMAIYAQGLRSTITAVARQISGNKKISVKDFGLSEHIAEEFVSQTKTADWLNKVFKYSAFSAVDRFGKNTHINAAFARGERLSRTPGGVKQLEAEYGKAFGKEFPQLVNDLKTGQMSERVRAYLFSELSDMQPVSKMELPQGYLDNPNGRLVYMLKSFMLKQYDIVRRDTYNEIKKGNIAKGIKNLTEYALILGIAGAATEVVKDWIMGRPVKLDAYDVLENSLKTFGWSEYVRDQVRQGKPIQAVAGMVVPPYRMMDDLIRRDPKAVQYIPIVGKLYYNWELGGKEKAEISQKRKSGERLSPEARRFQREERRRKEREKRGLTQMTVRG